MQPALYRHGQHGTSFIGLLIHEAGHVFADRYHPDNGKCDEWAWLGWEITVARAIGAYNAWSQQNADYYLGDDGPGKGKTWGELYSDERRAVIADRLAHAKACGVLSPGGAPQSVR